MAETDGDTALLEETAIVDTDVHLGVPREELARYADEPHASYLTADAVQLKSPGWDPSLGGRIDHRGVVTPEDVHGDVEGTLHVDHPILNAFVNLSRLSNTETAVHLQRACNDYLLDRFVDEGFLGLATVATQRPEAAAEEIDRVAGEDGIVGVFLVTTGPTPPLGDPTYDPIYDAAQDHGLPVVYHGATDSGFDVGFPKYNRAFERFVEAHVNAHLWSQSMTLTSLIVHGTPVKFPDLEFVIQEAGIGWVPYLTYRLNKEVSMRRSEAPLLEKQPEEYVRDRFYFTSQPLGEPMDPADMESLIDLVGAGSLLFASDYPHWDFDHPSELAAHARSAFTPEERERVFNGNAADVFGIDL